jgi:exosortase family protein XrtF
MQGSLMRFLGGGLLGYLLWYILYQYFLKDSTLVDEWLIHLMVLSVEMALVCMGFSLYEVSTADFRWQLGIDQSVGMLEIGASCDGLVLFALFAIFIIAFPGPSRNKLWFIPFGIAAIHSANILRVLSLVILNYYRPEALAFNHDYTWTVLIYGFIFWLWYLWTERYSQAKNMGGE